MLATGISHLVSHDTVYTRKLLRRGIDLDEPGHARLRHLATSAVMGPVPPSVDPTADLLSAAAVFAATGEVALSVLDAEGRYQGVLASRGLIDALSADEGVLVGDITSDDRVSSETPLGEALNLLDRGAEAVAVTTEGRVVGWLRHRDVLSALSS